MVKPMNVPINRPRSRRLGAIPTLLQGPDDAFATTRLSKLLQDSKWLQDYNDYNALHKDSYEYLLHIDLC